MTAQTPQATEAATPKIQYRVTNWPDYDRALVERGQFDDRVRRGVFATPLAAGADREAGGAVPLLG